MGAWPPSLVEPVYSVGELIRRLSDDWHDAQALHRDVALIQSAADAAGQEQMMSTVRIARLAAVGMTTVWLAAAAVPALAQEKSDRSSGIGIEYRVLATSKTSTMEKELNEAAEAGLRYEAVMGGETAFGGSEVVLVTSSAASDKGRFAYRLLATSKTSTMEKELQDAANAGYQYRGQTVFKSAFGGNEVVCILERDGNAPRTAFDYRLVATSKTGTLQKELNQVGAAGYQIVGMTVGKTAMGGNELVAIMRRPRE